MKRGFFLAVVSVLLLVLLLASLSFWTIRVSAAGDCGPPTIQLGRPTVDGNTTTINGITLPDGSGCTISSPISWSWGDGSQATSVFPASHTYSSTGTYQVTATTHQSDGQNTSASESVTISTSYCASANSSNDFAEQIPLAYGIAQSDLWNLNTAKGFLTQCFGSNTGLGTYISLKNIGTKNAGPAGYPEAAYGDNLDGTQFGQQQSFITFPIQLQSFNSLGLSVDVNYVISTNHPSSIDLTYDLWLKAAPTGSPTSADSEIMIDPVSTGTIIAPVDCWPISTLKNEVITINGVQQSSTWNLHKCIKGGTAAQEFIFSLAHPSQSLREEISIKPQDFISFISSHYNIPLNYWLMGIELGTEFDSLCVPICGGNVAWNWSMLGMTITDAQGQVVIVP